MKLTYRDIDASFYINSFIKQIMPGKRYEDWIIELLNKSKFFLEKSDGELYIRPPHESHGECDCVSSKYEIDFKLVGSKDFYQAKKELSPSFQIDDQNNLWINNGKAYKQMLHYNLHEISSKCTLEDIELIDLTDEEKLTNKEKAVLKGFVNILNVNKNAIFLIPATFSYGKVDMDKQELANLAAEKVFGAFDGCIKFREKHSDKESYWAFFYDDYFCVYDYIDKENYECILFIKARESEMFNKIYELVHFV